MMLDHLRLAEAAASVEAAVAADLVARGDSQRSTSQIGDDLAAAVAAGSCHDRPPHHHPSPRDADQRRGFAANPERPRLRPPPGGPHGACALHRRPVGPAGDRPHAPLTLDPATNSLHYGQSIFEGLKAYRTLDGGLALFRPERNAARFNRSAVRLAMPELPEDVFVSSVEALVELEARWVPTDAERSLYIRPFMLGTEVGLGVRPSAEYEFLIIAAPAGAYFAGGIQPVSVWLTDDYVRASPGGTGEAKCAGNYAASLVAQAEAAGHGCDQVVWLDAAERRWVERDGGMNLFFVYGEGPHARLLTPALTGSLLPGITRESLLTLAADLGYDVGEGG